MHEEKFQLVGILPAQDHLPAPRRKWYRNLPFGSLTIFSLILLGCFGCDLFLTGDPAYMDLQHCNLPPCPEFCFGTDTMGRDLFSMIWYGGRVSISIGLLATLISTLIAVVFGSVSGLAPKWLDTVLMRVTEILLSVPNLLLAILLQAVLGKANVFTLSLVLGITGWFSIAKVIRTEVQQLRTSEYVMASRCMGGSFFHILRHHLAPNFISSIMFMVVMQVRSAMIAEATLSFMGIGLPLEVISWGSMLSLSEKAPLSGSWWIILVPGIFLITTLLCLTDLGNRLRQTVNRRQSNL